MEIDIYMSSNEECLLPFSHHLALAVVENKWLMKNNLWHGKSDKSTQWSRYCLWSHALLWR